MLSENLKAYLVEMSDQVELLKNYQALIELCWDVIDDSQIDQKEQLSRINLLLNCYQEQATKSLTIMSKALTKARS